MSRTKHISNILTSGLVGLLDLTVFKVPRVVLSLQNGMWIAATVHNFISP